MARTNTNVVVVTGNLVRDPEDINGKGTRFAIAVNEAFKKQDSDDWEEYTSFIDCVQWGPRGKAVLNFCSKGSIVTVTGRLKQERWEKDGEKKSRVTVHAQQTEFAPKGAGGSSGSSGASETGSDDDGDDIPF